MNYYSGEGDTNMSTIQISHEVEQMCPIARGVKGEPAPIPQKGE